MYGASSSDSVATCSAPPGLSSATPTGKVYKVTEDRQAAPPKTDVFASFGGLLMLLKARRRPAMLACVSAV